jgi:superfamily II DNA/RNA helicase
LRNIMTFTDLGLDPRIIKAIESLGYTEPTEIQQASISTIIEGSDLIASAQTGTGKTAAFVLPALHCLVSKKRDKTKRKGPLVLILVPTRELGMQVASHTVKYSKFMQGVRTVCIYGGVPYHEQRKQLAQPYDILIATPGRLIDLLDQGRIHLDHTELFILDEVDRLLDVGFIEPIKDIASRLPETHQTIMFSATVKGGVGKLAQDLLKDPITVSVNSKSEMNENIEQRLHYVDNLQHKKLLLDHCLRDPTMNHAIIFTATKRYADELVTILREEGHKAIALHGDMQQRVRTRKISEFRAGKVKILVATDVAARGIDVKTVTHVLNFDLPRQVEDYVHRIGRTGRAGAKGIALSFASHKDRDLVKKIETYTGQAITPHEIEGLEPKEKPRAAAPSNRRGRSKHFARPFNKKGPFSNKANPRRPFNKKRNTPKALASS